MPKIKGKEISRDVLAEAMRCNSPEELMKLAKEQGVEITKEEAEVYISEIEDVDLDGEMLRQVAGGWSENNGKCSMRCRMRS